MIPDVSRAPADERRGRLVLWLVLLALALFPILPELTRWHGDERFYTDAAIRMVQDGDYWTPQYLDGRARFLKPILTYWAIAGSYNVFDISLFSSRLPFLLAGLALVALTARFARVLTGDRTIALLAALILASNLQFLALSVRATPDILVSLFVLASLLGFVRILFQDDRSFAARALAYGAAGLAVQTKGLLGVLPVAFALGFALISQWLDRRSTVPWRRLLDPRAIAIGAVLGAFWYAVVSFGRTEAPMDQFLADQVTAKVSFDPLRVLANWLVLSVAVVRHFLPWSLFAAVGLVWAARRSGWSGVRSVPREVWFCLGWLALVVLIFGLSEMRRTRYLCVAYPLVAVALARFLAIRWDFAPIAGTRKVTLFALAALLGVAGIGLLVGSARWGAALALGGLVGIAIAAWILRAARDGRIVTVAFGLALAPIAAFGVLESCIKPIFDPAAAEGIARRLVRELPQDATERATVRVAAPEPSLASQVWLISGGRLHVERASADPVVTRAAGDAPVLVDATQRTAWEGAGWTLEPIGREPGRWRPADVLAVWRTGDAGAAPVDPRLEYFLARRAPASSER